MPIITKIQQQKDRERVSIYLDGKFGFGVDLENFVKYKLKVEQELTVDEIEKIVNADEFTKTLNKLIKFGMTRPRSKKEYTDWFKRKKVHESMQPELLKRLVSLKLINDHEFANWWIGQRLQFKFKSKREIIQELRIKGVNKEIIDAEIDKQFNEDIELKNAKELVEKNEYKWRKFDEQKRRQKQIVFLQRKGFGWDVIKKITNSDF